MNLAGERAAIAQMLAAHQTLTLATSPDRQPWAATVFYASDPGFNLYFVSDHRTRHARDMAANPRVALAIGADAGHWHEVRGLQVEGEAACLAGPGREQALELFLGKFADVKALFATPESADEQIIAGRLRHAPFWRITPRFIRLIDNARGFGNKLELRL